ncbi:hypothetical protein AB0N73_06155 [Microbacterium sp. NPDC089189]|uniref:hypothetical protein n=1 Tax=Microbacterium sp. NPDC089189 TaxID=3154972 RepID=UPI00343D6259
MNRTLSVVRMQLINRQTFIWIPLIVLAGSLVITLAIYGILRGTGGVTINLYGGGAQAPLWYFLYVGVSSLTLTFPFSQAMSVTRREFFLGTLLTAVITSALLAAIFVAGGAFEVATNGWGMDGYFFALDWLWTAGPLVAFAFYFVTAMLFFIAGFWAATIFKRFGAMWLTIVLIGIAALLVLGLFVVARTDAWTELFGWFATIGAVGLTGLMAAVALVFAAIAFPALRRATP